jgi:hypothetical protein
MYNRSAFFRSSSSSFRMRVYKAFTRAILSSLLLTLHCFDLREKLQLLVDVCLCLLSPFFRRKKSQDLVQMTFAEIRDLSKIPSLPAGCFEKLSSVSVMCENLGRSRDMNLSDRTGLRYSGINSGQMLRFTSSFQLLNLLLFIEKAAGFCDVWPLCSLLQN